MSTSTPRGRYSEMRGVMLIAMAWRLERFVINRNRAVKERVVLGREVKKLKHRRADHPLIANQRLDDVRIGIARTRDYFSCSVLLAEVFTNLSHPLVVMFDRPVRIFIL